MRCLCRLTCEISYYRALHFWGIKNLLAPPGIFVQKKEILTKRCRPHRTAGIIFLL